MLHLFHGEQIDVSRKELQQLKERFKGREIIVLDGKTVTLTDLKQATESNSLFGSDRLIIVENLLSKRVNKKSTEFEIFANFITDLPEDVEMVFWEEKEQTKTVLNLFPKKTDIALFRPDRAIFGFTESLRPGATVTMLTLFEQSVGKDVPEMIFTMMIRHFHFLLMAKDLGKHIPELTPWQATKFAKQAEYFTLPQLIKLYKQLLDIDIKIKTGATPFNLIQEIRLFIMSI